ncbi:MAG TPA: hypothetical protein VKZ92_08805 [Pseudohongiella sp.]|nr:hypothetical protein [Pseudohongiella sp.]
MSKRATEIAEEIRRLEKELRQEIQRIRVASYEIRDRTIRFTDEALVQHRQQVLSVIKYLKQAKLRHVVSFPVIWLCLIPAVLMDIIVVLYQTVCFPLYGIPKVKRSDHVIIDRHHLRYLNVIEKLNCLYCSYFNGVISFVREVAGRTEQYWCPIKHANQVKNYHSRYHKFVDYGDASQYRESLSEIRRSFDDVQDQKDL